MSTSQDQKLQEALDLDRQDLLAVLSLRFGTIPAEVQERIATCTELAALERWILVAANVPTWRAFLEEFQVGSRAFKLVGPRFDPLTRPDGRADAAPHLPRRQPAHPLVNDAVKEQ